MGTRLPDLYLFLQIFRSGTAVRCRTLVSLPDFWGGTVSHTCVATRLLRWYGVAHLCRYPTFEAVRCRHPTAEIVRYRTFVSPPDFWNRTVSHICVATRLLRLYGIAHFYRISFSSSTRRMFSTSTWRIYCGITEWVWKVFQICKLVSPTNFAWIQVDQTSYCNAIFLGINDDLDIDQKNVFDIYQKNVKINCKDLLRWPLHHRVSSKNFSNMQIRKPNIVNSAWIQASNCNAIFLEINGENDNWYGGERNFEREYLSHSMVFLKTGPWRGHPMLNV